MLSDNNTIKHEQTLWNAGQTYHPAPSVPGVENFTLFDNLDDIKLIIVLSNVGLIQHTVIVLIHLWKTAGEYKKYICKYIYKSSACTHLLHAATFHLANCGWL